MGDWYHGKLDRQPAEERLRANGIPGAFLLRESDRKAGSFVLSYLGSTGINHFRITHVYGCYFIGGRKFDSLLDLITYYTSTSDLLLNERLAYPVSPPEPIAPQSKLFMATLPYTKLPQSDELSFKKGDILILQNDLGDSWLWCRHAQTGESGLVFTELIEEISPDIDPNEVYPWFHANITKTGAVEKLANEGPGSFLVRPSDNSPGNYSLFFHVGPSVQRFRISRDGDNRYSMGGRCFESLGHVIERYRTEQIVEGHYLRTAVTTHSRTTQLNEASALSSMKALEIKNRPHDIYATLRESREASKKKQSTEMVGMLWLKKNDMLKKWKLHYFVINSRDRHLYYFEKVNQTKPKGLIDLSCSYVYETHESLHDRSNCFQLVEKSLPCFANIFFVHCDQGPSVYKCWIESIKIVSANQNAGRPAHQSINNKSNGNKSDSRFGNIHCRNKTANVCDAVDNGSSVHRTDTKDDPFVDEVRSLHISFVEARSIPSSNHYFLVSFNQTVKVCRTQVTSSPTPIFEEDGQFILENLPLDVKTFTITLCSRSGKRSSRDSEVAEVRFELNRLSTNAEIDDWFEVTGIHLPIRENNIWGYVRLKIRYTRTIIMPYSEYSALEDLILDTNLEVITALEKLDCGNDRAKLSNALTNIFRCKNAIPSLLKAMIEREINLEAATLFRTSSLTTAIVECHFRKSCQSLVIDMFREPIQRIIENKISCELNPSKLELTGNGSEKACENLQNLLDLLDEFVERIFATVDAFPRSVRYICGCLQRAVEKRWPQDHLAKTRVVSTFIFSCLICPAILNPRQNELLQETLSETTARNLMLIAKCLQTMSNLVEYSETDYDLNPIPDTSLSTRVVSLTENPFFAVLESSVTNQMEPWMEVVNPFLLKNRTKLIRFIDDLSDVDQYPFVEPVHGESLIVDNNNSPAYDLAEIHTICESRRSKLEQWAITVPSVKKLATISDILTKHKQHYTNLRS